ncbi:hypothetical protein [Pararhizobium qamdonense]|uniref:hypothetical protein n=1 Tax=Pararhizobium qamdonense TaxID=3031126 RepID=UPI0023E1678B|nr:hypothetical protein [Pararhizobium qamdonense]
MHYLKIISNGWQGYNGQLNIITFRDGISTEPVPPLIADRIAASVRVVECDAAGEEGEISVNVGIQHRLIAGAAGRAPIASTLGTQTEAEKSMEAKLDAARSLTAPVESLFTRADLEKIADDSGMKGLRDIGDKWKVKGRGIPELIEKILAAQSTFLQLRNQKMETAGGQVLSATTLATDEEVEQIAEVQEEELVVAGYEGLADEYKILDVIVPGSTLAEGALKNSGKSLTGWNNLADHERKLLIDKEVEALEKHYDAKLLPFLSEPIIAAAINAETIVASQISAETLLGSSVLASSYDIAGETVQLGDIVAAAFATFGGTTAEWNGLENENREGLLRLELDKRLDAE